MVAIMMHIQSHLPCSSVVCATGRPRREHRSCENTGRDFPVVIHTAPGKVNPAEVKTVCIQVCGVAYRMIRSMLILSSLGPAFILGSEGDRLGAVPVGDGIVDGIELNIFAV